MPTKDKRLFFKNVFDSGIIDIWFNIVGATLATAAFIYMALKGYNSAFLLSTISYLFLITKATHGTRQSYEYLKEIYVYPADSNRLVSTAFYGFFLYFRIQIIIAPIQIILWTSGTGKLPI